MTHDNHIGSFGNGNNNNNNFYVNQNQPSEPPRPTHIIYRIKRGSMQHVSRKEVEKSVWNSGLGFTADVFGVLSFFGIQGNQAFSALQKEWGEYICGGIFIFGLVLLVFNYRNLILFTTSFSPQEANIFSDGTFAEKEDDGNYLRYQMTARCNYQNGICPGIVSIEAAPKREQFNHHTHIGKCDINGHHTYTVERSEYENIGFQQKFNFEPIDDPK